MTGSTTDAGAPDPVAVAVAAPRRVRLLRRVARRVRHGVDGATVVEFALVVPLLAMLSMGLLDGGITYFKWNTLGQASREGVRSAVDQPGDIYADYYAIKAASIVFNAIGPADVDRVVIYKATTDSDGDGNPFNNRPPAACLTGTAGVTGVCNVYTAADLRGDRTAFTAARKYVYWPGTARDLWADSGDTDYVGVYVAARVTPPTGVLGGQRLMSQFTVGRIEPQATNPPIQ